ncbi:glyoxalase [Williamsia sp.]|uniref:glyoxalase n=1 Tax=Williamsia sp. TaxID=1872085 RepID=UPI001A1ADE0C|nr:glyoxalase [Williamsia sp.]MBJ7291839.1 glyoxalase [Williamsia sp.]
MRPHPTLTSLRLAADPDAWRGCGVDVDVNGCARLGGVLLHIAGPDAGRGLLGWNFTGLEDRAEIAGIPVLDDITGTGGADHPLRIDALDHVVVMTGDLDRTLAALDDAGLDRRRIRETDQIRQAFYLVGPALIEVAAPREPTTEPARLWGLTVNVEDLDAAADLLGEKLGSIRDAVQPGRRIATVRREAGLGIPVALMTPRRPIEAHPPVAS